MPSVAPSVLANPSLDDSIKLKMLVSESGKTQASIADEIGVDRTYLSQMVNGKVSWTNSRYFPAVRPTHLAVDHLREIGELDEQQVFSSSGSSAGNDRRTSESREAFGSH